MFNGKIICLQVAIRLIASTIYACTKLYTESKLTSAQFSINENGKLNGKLWLSHRYA